MTGADRDRAVVLGCEIDRVRMNEAVALCRAAVEQQSFLQHMALNAAKIVSLRADSRLREAVAGSELVTADGQPWSGLRAFSAIHCRSVLPELT